MKNNKKKISVAEFAKINPVKTRRGHEMSGSYLYRLIRQDIAGELTRPLWFDYEFEGDKDSIKILVKA